MKVLTDADLMNRRRATHAGKVLSKVSIAAVIFLFLSAFASLFVTMIAAMLIVMWFAFTITLVGLPLLMAGDGWLGILRKLTNTVEFGGTITDFMIKLTAPLAAISISCAVVSVVLLFLGAGENKSSAVPRTVVSAIVVIIAIVCIIFARGIK